MRTSITVNQRKVGVHRPLMVAILLATLTSNSLALLSPSQQPLFRKAGTSVPPNIFYTLDDSGSMALAYAPDDAWPNGESDLVFPRFHQNDDLVAAGVDNCLVNTPLISANTLRSSLSTNNRLNIDLRTPQINRIYYNPEILYQPWAKGSPYVDSNSLFKPSTFTAANTDPRKIINASDTGAASGVVDLSYSVTASTTLGNTWCGSSGGYRPAASLSIPFFPATYYLLSSTGTLTRYTLSGSNPPASFTFPAAYKRRTDCTVTATSTTCSLTAERQNFANWFTYYRSRSLLARGATSLAFSAIDQQVRIGYGQLNNGAGSKEGSTTTIKTITRGVRKFDVGSAERTQFFNWLYKVPYRFGTPLRSAMDDVGRYFSNTSSAGPWSDTPGVSSYTDNAEVWRTQASCRRSYHVLMTDGYWNGAGASNTNIANKNVDGTATTTEIANNEKGRTYKYDPTFTNGISSGSPYADKNANTLADVAAFYWSRDLHPGLANNIRVNMATTDKTVANKPYYNAAEKIDRGDHAFWQHLTTYTVGLGITGNITDTTTVPPASGWPMPVENQRSTVDDLFHAAVNGRGRYLKASDPQEYQDAIEQTLNEIFAAEQGNSGIAFSSFEVSASSKRFIPSFSQPDWVGDVTAYPVNSNIALWTASSALPNHTDRNIGVWNGSAVEPFTTGLSAGVRSLMGSPSNDLINFLRGDRSLEGSTFRCRGDLPNTKICTKSKDASGNFTKSGLFGDVVNSRPLLIGGAINMNYQQLADTDGAGYLSYLGTKQARKKKVLMVGANDGMLHLLDEDSGKELYAFIPQAVTPFLKRLGNPGYGSTTDDALDTTHRFFVDGRLNESDAKIGGNWTNVVVGSTGGGAKSVFALKFDTSNPQDFTASPVMWEINALPSSTLTDKDKLGHVMGSITVGRMKNGRWVAIFGNGYGSTAGGAYLWIVDIATGAPIRSPIQAGTDTSDNGLGAVSVVRDSNRNIVAAYAGDGKGRLWRFDLHSANPAEWQTGFANTPLLTPGTSNTPVTAAPLFVMHPNGGLMVMYATGRLFTNADADDSSIQHIYGVWDLTRVGRASVDGAGATPNQLVEHTLDKSSSFSVSGGTAYQIKPSSTEVTYTDSMGIRGWKIKQVISSGERAVFDPSLLGNIAVFSTLAPTLTNATDPCTSITSQTYLYYLQPLTGKMPPYAITDTNGDGVVNQSDDIIGTSSQAGSDDPEKFVCKGGTCPCTSGDCGGSPTPACPAGSRAYGVASSASSQTICVSTGYNVRTWQQLQNFPKQVRE